MAYNKKNFENTGSLFVFTPKGRAPGKKDPVLAGPIDVNGEKFRIALWPTKAVQEDDEIMDILYDLLDALGKRDVLFSAQISEVNSSNSGSSSRRSSGSRGSRGSSRRRNRDEDEDGGDDEQPRNQRRKRTPPPPEVEEDEDYGDDIAW